MPTDPFSIVCIVLAIGLAGLAKGGFSGVGMLSTPLLAMVFPPVQAAAIFLPILLVQDAFSVWLFRRSWNRSIVAWMLPGAAVGIVATAYMAASLPERAITGLLGLISLGFGGWRLWLERGGRIPAPSRPPAWLGLFYGAAAGATSQIAHAGAPPFQMWVMPKRLPHLEYVGTSSITFAAINWMKVPAYWSLGALSWENMRISLLLVPFAVGATVVGACIIRKLDAARFYTLANALLVMVGARLMWQALVA